MTNEMLTPGTPALPTTQMINQGPGPQIAHLDGNVIYNQFPPEMLEQMQTIFGLAQAQIQQQQSISHAIEWDTLSHKRFCLFVLDNETYREKAFSIAKARALKYSPEKEYFLPLTDELCHEIQQMPCIFAKRNLHRDHTEASHPVLYGRITSIVPQDATIKFCFEYFKSDFQETINQNIERFGLLKCRLWNQLDEEHWSIRNGNLQEILMGLGIQVE